MDDLIRRQDVIDKVNAWTYDLCDPEDDWAALKEIKDIPPAQPEIIRCKDCHKHNISPRSQKDCCPLYHYRGMSFGSEHDLQFCSFAERLTDG